MFFFFFLKASGGAAGESAPAPTAHEEEDDEEAMMRRAIEMSMRDFDEQTRAVSSAEEQPETTPLNMAIDEVPRFSFKFSFLV